MSSLSLSASSPLPRQHLVLQCISSFTSSPNQSIPKKSQSLAHISTSHVLKKNAIKPLVLEKGVVYALRFVGFSSAALAALAAKNAASNDNASDIPIELYTGPSLDIRKTPLTDYFEIHQRPDTSSQSDSDIHAPLPIIEFRLIKDLPPDLICSFLEFRTLGAIAVCSSSTNNDKQCDKIVLSTKNQLFLTQEDFSRHILGRKLKRKRAHTHRKLVEYEGVRISEWVQVDDDEHKVSYVDSQLREPGDGVCIFNWVSFRSAAARLIEERVEREKKYGVSTTRKKKKPRIKE